jgi:hypothetical protein
MVPTKQGEGGPGTGGRGGGVAGDADQGAQC